MEKIKPFKDAAEAISHLDNGGRFYNIFTHSNDRSISHSEVGKVAGLYFGKQKEILFLELAIAGLDENSKAAIMDKFDAELQESYNKYKAHDLLPSEVNDKGMVASNVIIKNSRSGRRRCC
ncbi:hypothetical protein [Chitinophaga sp. HK235]|uniref:hypothetical protein n=1 Tax=Chitinophaga sp. HK235 TaxID=2952571 RepID=UPI001BADBBF3|nr:hypothetical protein [Chitinophaga sp. HK235]